MHPALRYCALPLAAVLATSTIVISGCGSSPAASATTLDGVIGAQVVHADGSVAPATDGLRLRRGDLVRTTAAGRAELRTRGRVVYEGSDAAVLVADGASAELRHGAVVVDAQHGPRLSLTVAGLAVAVGPGDAVRAERSVAVRVATLAGDAGVDNRLGRHLDVPALTQALLGGDALPDSTEGSPLRLTDDDGEAHAVPALVREDVALVQLAAGIDATGTTAARAVLTAWHAGLQSLPHGVARSEQILPLVLASAVPADAAVRYSDAVRLRRAGASWGVVAARLHTTAAAALAALEAFEHAVSTGQVGSISAAIAALTGDVAGSASRTAAGGGSGGGAGGSGGGTSSPRPGSGGSTSPSPSPTSSSDLVASTIDTVLSLVPTASPSPTSTAAVQVPLPVPSAGVPSLPTVPGVGAVTPAPLPLQTP